MSIPYPRFTGSEPCLSTDPEAFFPADNMVGEVAKILRRVCEPCELKAECAQWAIRHEAHGFWGGMTPSDRQRYRKKYGVPFEAPVWPYGLKAS
jgi:hypothetical protein